MVKARSNQSEAGKGCADTRVSDRKRFRNNFDNIKWPSKRRTNPEIVESVKELAKKIRKGKA